MLTSVSIPGDALPWSVLEWRTLHTACLEFASAPAASFDQVADNIALELCGAEESHVSGLSIWILTFGFIIMLIAISTFQNMGLGYMEFSGEFLPGATALCVC